MPCAEPVMIAVLPSSSPIFFKISLSSGFCLKPRLTRGRPRPGSLVRAHGRPRCAQVSRTRKAAATLIFMRLAGRFAVAAVALAGILGAAGAPASNAATLPTGFDETTLASGLNLPVGIAWAPDGRLFITEKDGVVKVVP